MKIIECDSQEYSDLVNRTPTPDEMREFWEARLAHGDFKAFRSDENKKYVEELLGRPLDFPVEPLDPAIVAKARKDLGYDD
jgi:hypothetical protein